MNLYSKSANEHLKISLNWATELAVDTTTILSATWTLPTGITLVSQSLVGSNTNLVVSGGTSGVEYSITCRITTAEVTAKYYEQGVVLQILDSVSQPTNSYASLAEIATDLSLSSVADLTRLNSILSQTSRWVDSYCNKKFYYEVGIVERIKPTDSSFLRLERAPLRTITSITYDGATLSPSTYTVENYDISIIRAVDNDFEPYNVLDDNYYTVTYNAGFYLPGQASRDLPWDIENAVASIVTETWMSRSRDPSIIEQSIPGVITEKFRVSSKGFQGASTLDRYRVRRF